jgi:hypothetical protein
MFSPACVTGRITFDPTLMISIKKLFLILFVTILSGCAAQKQTPVNPYGPAKKTYSAAETSRTIDLTNPPQDLWDRIRRGFAVPNLQDPLVDHWTNYYASHPQSVLTMSKRASKYLYHIVEELEQRGLPTELALLPFVESAYNPVAYSKAKASGLWQFIPSTGRHYNLEQDWWRDQRRDPIASTNAALDYLSYLYDFQGDWYLALASYNWGEGSVKRAMEKNAAAGIPTDYGSLTMPEETRNYVPKLQAIKNIITAPRTYGLTLPAVSNAGGNDGGGIHGAECLLQPPRHTGRTQAHADPAHRPPADLPGQLGRLRRQAVFLEHLQEQEGRELRLYRQAAWHHPGAAAPGQRPGQSPDPGASANPAGSRDRIPGRHPAGLFGTPTAAAQRHNEHDDAILDGAGVNRQARHRRSTQGRQRAHAYGQARRYALFLGQALQHLGQRATQVEQPER